VFTGIVEELGSVVEVEDRGDAVRMVLRGPLVVSDAQPGDSIAVNGVCLTVVDPADGCFGADVMAETLHRSSLGALAPGSAVNLERAARIDARIGGHIVQGHVDGVATVESIAPSDNWTTVSFALPGDLARYVVEKGSITVDGVSLTVVSVDDSHFSVSLIPTTLEHTTLGSRSVGDRVNIEVDVLAKYVERLLGWRNHDPRG
jgi:riboflavin synthase